MKYLIIFNNIDDFLRLTQQKKWVAYLKNELRHSDKIDFINWLNLKIVKIVVGKCYKSYLNLIYPKFGLKSYFRAKNCPKKLPQPLKKLKKLKF